MKINELSSNRRSKGKMGACPQDRSGFVLPAASTIRWGGPGGHRSALNRCWSGDSRQPTRVEAEGGKVARGGTAAPIKMLKMKVDPEMCMKTKDRTTFCLTQKTTFVPGRMLFYTKIHVLCTNRQLICHHSSLGERTSRFKMERRPRRERDALPPLRTKSPRSPVCHLLLPVDCPFPTPTFCRERASRPWPNPRQP